MRAEYDSEADALQIYLTEDGARWASGVDIEGHQVDYDDRGRPAGIELLDPAAHIERDLPAIAASIGEDPQALVAIARAALAAPDRQVTLTLAGRAA
ncbi:MAG: DUF2283 domain-containing protein [Miltoncostaeaceae bacterium]